MLMIEEVRKMLTVVIPTKHTKTFNSIHYREYRREIYGNKLESNNCNVLS